MNSIKCRNCGLVNFAGVGACRRCGGALDAAFHFAPAGPGDPFELPDDSPAPRRGLLKRAAAVCGATALLLVVFYVSLLESSEPLRLEQKLTVERAVAHVERSGLARDAFFLRRLASYRATDNWWNRWFGHQNAYAATNFPFEIVTLYPEFFDATADDAERAAVLLHEARHLRGAGEEEAFASVWRDKEKLGWTRASHARTPVFRNVHELTIRYVPALFACGPERRADCTE